MPICIAKENERLKRTITYLKTKNYKPHPFPFRSVGDTRMIANIGFDRLALGRNQDCGLKRTDILHEECFFLQVPIRF